MKKKDRQRLVTEIVDEIFSRFEKTRVPAPAPAATPDPEPPAPAPPPAPEQEARAALNKALVERARSVALIHGVDPNVGAALVVLGFGPAAIDRLFSFDGEVVH
jgi:hypothetical protein